MTQSHGSLRDGRAAEERRACPRGNVQNAHLGLEMGVLFFITEGENMRPSYEGLFMLFLIFSGVYFLLIRPGVLEQKKRRNAPDLSEYLRQNPQCKTDSGIKCIHCGSKSIRNLGLAGAATSERIHVCNSCGAKLYKSHLF